MIYEYNATITRVVDGDTVDMEVDCGFRIKMRDRFRLWGINAPERGQEGWSAANAHLSATLPVGQAVLIRTEHPTTRDPKDKYGRWLATIFVDGLNVNQDMVDREFAVEFMR